MPSKQILIDTDDSSDDNTTDQDREDAFEFLQFRQNSGLTNRKNGARMPLLSDETDDLWINS